jgi:hypothetical protein
MYFPWNWEFGSDLSKVRNFGGGGEGGLNPPTPPRYATGMDIINVLLSENKFLFTFHVIFFCVP